MHARYTTTPLQALYRIFVLPNISAPSVRQSTWPLTRPQRHLNSRTFTTTTPRPLTKARAPEQRAQKWDNEITSRLIYLIPPDTNRLIDPETNEHIAPVTKWDTLNSLDTKTHRLIQVSVDPPHFDPDYIPVCKIVSKKELYDSDRRRKEQQKEQKRVQKVVAEGGQKTIELNWAIAEGDLTHRMGRMREFLQEGRRVEVVLAGKKRGRKASKEECENVLTRVREAVEGVEGAKEREAWTGKMGGFMNAVFQGKPTKAGTSSANTGEDAVQEKE